MIHTCGFMRQCVLCLCLSILLSGARSHLCMSASALRLYGVRCSPRVSTCFHVLLLHVVFCISSTSLRNMTSLVFLPNREWFVVCVGAQNITVMSGCSILYPIVTDTPSHQQHQYSMSKTLKYAVVIASVHDAQSALLIVKIDHRFSCTERARARDFRHATRAHSNSYIYIIMVCRSVCFAQCREMERVWSMLAWREDVGKRSNQTKVNTFFCFLFFWITAQMVPILPHAVHAGLHPSTTTISLQGQGLPEKHSNFDQSGVILEGIHLSSLTQGAVKRVILRWSSLPCRSRYSLQRCSL